MSPTGGSGHGSERRQTPRDGRRARSPAPPTPPRRPADPQPRSADQPLPAPLAAPRVTMTIPSDYHDAREVQRRIREEVERAGFDSDSQFAIKLSLEEAMINAIKHGNRQDPNKRVHVEWSVTPERTEIVIEDEGPGFERTNVPDPTDDANLEKLTGRGILLMEAYMTRVEFSRGGRRVRLIKDNQALPAPDAKSA